MGLIPLESITVKDYQEFESAFDIEISPKTKSVYEKYFIDIHLDGKELIEKNDSLRFEAEKYYKEKLLKVKSIDNMKGEEIYYYGRRLGLKREKKNKMKQKLKKIYKQTKALREVNMRNTSIIEEDEEDYDMLNTEIRSENIVNNDMDVENNQSEQDSDLNDHQSDPEIMNEITHATYGKYCNQQEDEDTISANREHIMNREDDYDMDSDEDVDILEQKQLMQIFTSQLLDNECSCECHIKEEMDTDYVHCPDCHPLRQAIDQCLQDPQNQHYMNVD